MQPWLGTKGFCASVSGHTHMGAEPEHSFCYLANLHTTRGDGTNLAAISL